MRRWLPLVLLFSLPAGLAEGCEAPAPARFVVHHSTFGDIGRHDVTFACEDDRLIVETRAEIAVEILSIEAFRRSVHYIESWAGDRLLEFFGETIDDGERRVVRAWLEDGRMVIDGPSGRLEAPPEVIPSHPWNPVSVERTLLFDVAEGALLDVTNEELGEDYVKVGDDPRPARHYLTTGAKPRELWYAADGSWLQWRLERKGTVTLTRTPG